MNSTLKPLKITVAVGELRTHRLLLSRLNQALAVKDFSLTVIFPTLSLLNFIQDEWLNQPGVQGIGGIRFFLFEGFLELINERFGLGIRQPSLLERNLLISRCFQKLTAEGKLDYLNRAPFTAVYRRAILQGIAEWQRGRLSAEVFKAWAAGKGEKERQLALLYQSYQDLLSEYGFGEADHLLVKLQSKRNEIKTSPMPAPVLIYGFTDLTPLQNAFIDVLSPGFNFEIILDPTEVQAFRELSARYFNIPELAERTQDKQKTVSISGAPLTFNPDNGLALFQERFWRTEKPEIIPLQPGDESLRLIQAAGAVRQATGIAREIAALLKADPALGPEDFLILAPDPVEFKRTAAPVFKEYRLPLSGLKIPLIEFPWINQLSNLLIAASDDWQWPDLEVLIRQYYRETPSDGERLLLMIGERYGALSGRECWLKLVQSDSFQQYFQELGFNLQPLRLAISHLTAIPARALLRDYLAVVNDLLAALMTADSRLVPETAVFKSGCDLQEAQNRRLLNYRAVQLMSRSISEWRAFLDRVPDEQPEIGVLDFKALLNDYLLNRSDLEVEPLETGRQAIRVLPPREARGLKVRLVFITGLEQGVFPRTYINDWKVDTKGRFELATRGIELETGTHYLIQEKLAFYWAIQSAVTRLYLVYQDQDSNGQPLNRSLFLDEVLEWVPELGNRRQYYPLAPGLPGTLGECHSDFEIRGWWARFLGRGPEKLPAVERSCFETVVKSAFYRQLMNRIRGHQLRRARPMAPLFQDPRSFELIGKMFGPDYVFAITALEDYRSCPYRFFLKRVLKAKTLMKPELVLPAPDLGNLYHQILESFAGNFRDTVLRPEYSAVYKQFLEECFQGHYREWQEAAGCGPAQLLLLLKEKIIRRNLKRWLETELQWTAATQGRFAIKYLEFAFGLTKGDYDSASLTCPYQLGEGLDQVKIWGKIDRVDVDASGNFVVYDYKSGWGPSVKEIMKADYLQLPVYIMALEQLLPGAATAAGGSYLGLKAPSRSRSGVWRRSRIDLEGAGVLTEEEWHFWLNEVQNIITGTVRAIRSGEFHLVGKECLKYCEYRDVCRREGWEVNRADEQAAESATS